MATPSSTFTEMVTTTDRNWANGLADNVSKHNALLRRMKAKGRVKTISGGYELVERLEYAENSTFQRFAGYDTLNVGQSDVLTAAKFPLRNAAIMVTASGTELRMNSGEEAMMDLVKSRKKNALRTAENAMSRDLYSSGSLDNQIGGLANIIQTNGEGTVGGINSATYTFWKNKFKEMTGTNIAATPTVANAVSMKGDMNALWLSLNRGQDKPDLIVMTHDFYSLFEVGEQSNQRYADASSAEAGFSTLKYKGADVVFDDDSTSFTTTGERAYFLNTDYLRLVQHSEAQWTPDTEKRPTNQDSVIIPYYWMGNLVTSNRSLQGILFDAA